MMNGNVSNSIRVPVLPGVELASTTNAGDAVEETKQHSHVVTMCSGGRGAVREVIEFILKAQDKWDEAMARYL